MQSYTKGWGSSSIYPVKELVARVMGKTQQGKSSVSKFSKGMWLLAFLFDQCLFQQIIEICHNPKMLTSLTLLQSIHQCNPTLTALSWISKRFQSIKKTKSPRFMALSLISCLRKRVVQAIPISTWSQLSVQREMRNGL